ncbi:hypothetical protein M433DRAFT_480862 [Acidomyces richmondensis BFW]|nr:MAG: hypothetical protein FE78DRAFT_428150 [Acidomyces sp. 'richmondensis']KYG50223.1 hypothetical protein M433DRAFT_480862 [Acidomyces richmondensis BFW]
MAEWLVGCNVLEGGWKDPSPASELSPGRGRTNGTAVQLDEDLRSPRQVQQTDWDSSTFSAGLTRWSRSTSPLAPSTAGRDAPGGESCRLAFISPSVVWCMAVATGRGDGIHGMKSSVRLPIEWVRQRTNRPGAAVRRTGRTAVGAAPIPDSVSLMQKQAHEFEHDRRHWLHALNDAEPTVELLDVSQCRLDVWDGQRSWRRCHGLYVPL